MYVLVKAFLQAIKQVITGPYCCNKSHSSIKCILLRLVLTDLPSAKESKDRIENMWVNLNTDLFNYTSSSLLSSVELVLQLLSHTPCSVNRMNM